MSVNTSSADSLISRIIYAGISEDLPEYLKRRVLPTNIVSLLIFVVVGIPFSIITYIYFPSLVWYPFIGGLLCAGVMAFNYFGAIRYSRIIVSLVPIVLGAIYNASLSGPEDDPLPSLYLLELSFSVIPFLVFDINKEKWAVSFSVVCCVIIIITFPFTKNWLHTEYDSLILRSGWLNSLTILLAAITMLSCVLGLVAIGKKAEKESETLLKKAEEEKQKLELQQKENLKKSEELSKTQAEEKKRQWANEGITMVSQVLREFQDNEKLYDKVLSTIVKYLNANQGGLFIVENEKDSITIHLKACYAYGRKKHIEQTILPGQGLIGQTYLEQQYIYLTEVPKNYVSITSGLGEATPSALIIMPMMANDKVQGLLELASFQTFAAHEILFLEKLNEIIAAHINNQKVVTQTQLLLMQAQEQSEELRAQEEEMRQNMEELTATQEHAQRQAEENKGLYERLKIRESVFGYTTILSEADTYGTITFANDKLCEVSKYAREELIGKGHNIFRHPDMPKALFKIFWQTIQQGKVFKGIIKNRAKDGSHYWVDATIVPIKDDHGKITKYIGARYHITDDFIAEHLYDQQLKNLGIEEKKAVW